jgi:peptidylprolyl isomerase
MIEKKPVRFNDVLSRAATVYVAHRKGIAYLSARTSTMSPSPFRVSILLLCSLPLATAQDRSAEVRREKIESLLRIQDTRTPHDGALRVSLGDADTLVRERATLACGSLQDTSLLGLIIRNLTEAPPVVQQAAAFAIGQTGTSLSEAGRRRLEEDLLINRLHVTTAADRLIEELGKFGTHEGLDDLMIRVGNVYPPRFERGMLMAIARFAVRGIVSDDAVRYVLRYLRPEDSVPWEAAYALQRVGDHPLVRGDIEQVALLRKHPDPLVRMAAASLMGRLKGMQAVLEPLLALAAFDSDWRVRVNALRALSSAGFGDNERVRETFRRGFSDDNLHIAVSALSACGASGELREGSPGAAETLAQLRRLAENADGNYPWQVQAEAAVALARCAGQNASSSLQPEGHSHPRLQARILEALGISGDRSSLPVLLESAERGDPLIRMAALDALRALAVSTGDSVLGESAYAAVAQAASDPDVAVAATAAALLRDPPLRRPEAVDVLLHSLSLRRIPDDIEALQETITTLGVLGDSRAVSPLREQLQQPDLSVARAAAAALRTLTGVDYSGAIPQRAQPLLTDFDFEFLRSLPEALVIRIETIRGDIGVELIKQFAPFSIMSLLKLADRRGLYRGVPFHRVVPNFVIQGGDPRGDGWGGPGYTIRSEFSPATFATGTMGMASAGKDTEGSQFFITHSPQPHLDGRYTILGRVIAGQDVVDRIQPDDRIFAITVVGPSKKAK